MKICPRCKKEVDNDLRFCPYCAMKLPPAPREIPLEKSSGPDRNRQENKQENKQENRQENTREDKQEDRQESRQNENQPEKAGKDPIRGLKAGNFPNMKKAVLLPVILLLLAALCVILFSTLSRKSSGGGRTLSASGDSPASGNPQTSGNSPASGGSTVPGDSPASGNSPVSPAATEQSAAEEEKQEVRVLGPETSFSDYLKRAEEIRVTDAMATSTIHQEGRSNTPALLFDKNDMTNWEEGVDGYGEGEKVTAYFQSSHELRMISFKIGNWYSSSKHGHDYYYNGNCRPKILRLDFGDQKYLIPFQDVMEEQLVVFKYPVPCDHMIVEIVEVYPGNRFSDTVITEITPYEVRGPVTFPVSDGSWLSGGSEVWYRNANGSYTMDGWQTIDGSLYFFDERGYAVRNRWIQWNGNSYYLGDDGRLLTDGTAPDGSRVDSSGIKQ